MTATHTKHKIVKSTKNGQITIPIEFRKQLGAEGEGLWQISLSDHALKIVPVQVEESTKGSLWVKELYDLFAPVREEILLAGYTEEEINADIDAAVRAVREDRD